MVSPTVASRRSLRIRRTDRGDVGLYCISIKITVYYQHMLYHSSNPVVRLSSAQWYWDSPPQMHHVALDRITASRIGKKREVFSQVPVRSR